MNYRKGDIFVHRKKGTIAIITAIGEGTYDFKYSHPNDKADSKPPWSEVKGKPIEDITYALDNGFVEIYRPYRSMFDDSLFEAD